MKSSVGERGQIVIPKQIRDRLRLEKGMILEVETSGDDGAIVLRPIRKRRKDWRDWIGVFAGDKLTQKYLRDKKKEKEKEVRWIE